MVDAGLVVLIWVVQLIIYPSFLYYQKEDLINWHSTYTSRIAIVVIPLMLAQLVISVIETYTNLNLFTVISLLILLFLWGFTFTSFAPIHLKITNAKADKNLLSILVKRNWMRTFCWTFLFFYHIYTLL